MKGFQDQQVAHCNRLNAAEYVLAQNLQTRMEVELSMKHIFADERETLKLISNKKDGTGKNNTLTRFLSELLYTAELFKWKYFLVKSLIFSNHLEVYGLLISQNSDHMA